MIFRIYFYSKSQGYSSISSILNSLNHFHSFKFLFLTSRKITTNNQGGKYIKISNLFLIVFYFLFLIFIFWIIKSSNK